MSSVFILGLSDSYTREKLFQLQPVEGKTTVKFDVLITAASAIQQAKDKGGEAAAPPPAESTAESGAPAAALNSIEQVRPPYQFNPEPYQDYKMEDCGWWSLEALCPKPIQTKQMWARMEAVSSGPA
jgi:hypothetical protein